MAAEGLAARWLTPWSALAVILALAGVVIMWAGRQTTIFADQWAWLFGVLHVNAHTFLQDYNGHLIATTLAVFYGLGSTVGLTHYWAFRAVAVVLHLGVGLLMFLLARQRIGPWLAVAATAVIALLGTGSDAFLTSENINLLLALVACLAALLMLDRHTGRADLAASALLVIGLASFTTAVAFTIGVLAEVLCQRDRWRRIWVPVAPMALYVVWRVIWGQSVASGPGTVLDIIKHAFEAATGAVAGLGGIQLDSATLKTHLPWLGGLAQVIVLLGLALLARFVIRGRHISPRFVNVAVTGGALWLLIGTVRGSMHDLYALRYVYAGAVVAMLILVEAASWRRIPRSRAAWLVLVGITISVPLNIAWMVVWGNHLRQRSALVSAQLAGLNIAGSRALPSYRPGFNYELGPIIASLFFQAERRFGGSPTYTSAELQRAPEPLREAADQILLQARDLRLVPGHLPTGGPPPEVERSANGSIVQHVSCVTLIPRGSAATVEILPRSKSGVLLQTPGGMLVSARRFGDRFTGVLGGVSGSSTLATPLGRAPQPWHLELSATARARICDLR